MVDDTGSPHMRASLLIDRDGSTNSGRIGVLFDLEHSGAIELADLGEQAVSSHGTYLPEQLRGQFYLYAGELESARTELNAARDKLENMLAEQPNQGNTLRALCQVVGGLGDRAAAESACAGAIEHERIDAFDQTMSRYEIALGLASAGLHEQAIDQIEFLLAGPVGKSFSRYEIEPAFRPLHQNPRWQALKTKYGVGE